LGNFQNSIEHLRNDDYFAGLDFNTLANECMRYDNFQFGRVVNRVIAGWYFEAPYELNGTDWGSRFEEEYKWLQYCVTINHDLGHLSGYEKYKNSSREENIENFRAELVRRNLANAQFMAFINNCKIMSLLKQISEK